MQRRAAQRTDRGANVADGAATLAPAYVGAARCAACHGAETAAWRGSHHDRAMEEPSPESVVGDFDDARFEHFGVTSRFFRRAGRPLVETEGADGKLVEFEVAWTFGVDPLQQYLVRFPNGHVQALGIAWDARPAAADGQRWFSLYPDERIPPGDVLHWTAPSQRWNTQCAECHSTALRRGYEPDRDAHETTWAELDVACETCHGPGSAHVAWAEAAARGETAPARRQTQDGTKRLGAETPRHQGARARHSRRYGERAQRRWRGWIGVQTRSLVLGRSPSASAARELPVCFPPVRPEDWILDPGARIARLRAPRPVRAELETCAPCHSRRTPLREASQPGDPFLDGYRLALLDEGLYEADGQPRDEVFVYGSFVQSRMHAAGVTCSDCHREQSAE